jgi:hypothetical protein
VPAPVEDRRPGAVPHSASALDGSQDAVAPLPNVARRYGVKTQNGRFIGGLDRTRGTSGGTSSPAVIVRTSALAFIPGLRSERLWLQGRAVHLERAASALGRGTSPLGKSLVHVVATTGWSPAIPTSAYARLLSGE